MLRPNRIACHGRDDRRSRSPRDVAARRRADDRHGGAQLAQLVAHELGVALAVGDDQATQHPLQKRLVVERTQRGFGVVHRLPVDDEHNEHFVELLTQLVDKRTVPVAERLEQPQKRRRGLAADFDVAIIDAAEQEIEQLALPDNGSDEL
jgi:hypothetical protein